MQIKVSKQRYFAYLRDPQNSCAYPCLARLSTTALPCNFACHDCRTALRLGLQKGFLILTATIHVLDYFIRHDLLTLKLIVISTARFANLPTADLQNWLKVSTDPTTGTSIEQSLLDPSTSARNIWFRLLDLHAPRIFSMPLMSYLERLILIAASHGTSGEADMKTIS